MEEIRVGDTCIVVVPGDLTTQSVDAVVNPANEHLHQGGGLAAALVTAGGAVIQEESDAWVAAHGPLSPGVAAVTGAGSLPARHVVHVAGPRYRKGQDNEGLLGTAVTAALEAAASSGCRTVAMPAISTGIFGYPFPAAAAVIAARVVEWTAGHPAALTEVRLVGIDNAAADVLRTAVDAARHRPPQSGGRTTT